MSDFRIISKRRFDGFCNKHFEILYEKDLNVFEPSAPMSSFQFQRNELSAY
jgi:hypothetical protein